MFSSRADRAWRAYQRFVEAGEDVGHQGEYGKGSEEDSRILGDRFFIEKVLGEGHEGLRNRVTVERIVSYVCGRFLVREDELSAPGKDRKHSRVRALAAWLVLDSGGLRLAELSKRVHRDSSTLSSAARSLEIEAQTDVELKQMMSKMREDLFEIQTSKA